MQIKIYTIPAFAEAHDLDELNLFLRANKIIDIKKDVAEVDGNSCWTFCITYMPSTHPVEEQAFGGSPRRSKVDYKETLSEAAFARFAKMRKLRKQIAESEAVPAYAVFTDAELAEIAKLDVLDTLHMKKIPGIGDKKVEKYGNAFCMIDYTQLSDEESGTSDRADSRP